MGIVRPSSTRRESEVQPSRWMPITCLRSPPLALASGPAGGRAQWTTSRGKASMMRSAKKRIGLLPRKPEWLLAALPLSAQPKQPVGKAALFGEAEEWRPLARRAREAASRGDAATERNT